MRATTSCVSLMLVLAIADSGSGQEQDLARLPSGPDGPGVFGAYYTHLKHRSEWDKEWRVGDHPDIVV